MKTTKLSRRSLAGLLLAGTLAGSALSSASIAAPPPSLASWEIAGQLNSSTNPFEVWSYGYKTAADCTGPFVAMTNAISKSYVGRNFVGWRRGASATDTASLPEVLQSSPSTLLVPLQLSPKGLSMHPGPAGECAVVRFTAPAEGKYLIVGRFWAQNSTAGSTNTNTQVVQNNSTMLDNANVVGAGASNPFQTTVGLAAGGTIDFMVGANGSFISDSTGLHGYIERK